MNSYTIAKRIPDIIRQKRLLTETDPIAQAIASSNNPQMMLLAEVWYTFIEPHKERMYCGVCLANILENFRALKQDLIRLESEYQLLQKL